MWSCSYVYTVYIPHSFYKANTFALDINVLLMTVCCTKCHHLSSFIMPMMYLSQDKNDFGKAMVIHIQKKLLINAAILKW